MNSMKDVTLANTAGIPASQPSPEPKEVTPICWTTENIRLKERVLLDRSYSISITATTYFKKQLGTKDICALVCATNHSCFFRHFP